MHKAFFKIEISSWALKNLSSTNLLLLMKKTIFSGLKCYYKKKILIFSNCFALSGRL
ncbi:hypothetical protein ACRRTK_024167 [Alexandromys fortis]